MCGQTLIMISTLWFLVKLYQNYVKKYFNTIDIDVTKVIQLSSRKHGKSYRTSYRLSVLGYFEHVNISHTRSLFFRFTIMIKKTITHQTLFVIGY